MSLGGVCLKQYPSLKRGMVMVVRWRAESVMIRIRRIAVVKTMHAGAGMIPTPAPAEMKGGEAVAVRWREESVMIQIPRIAVVKTMYAGDGMTPTPAPAEGMRTTGEMANQM